MLTTPKSISKCQKSTVPKTKILKTRSKWNQLNNEFATIVSKEGFE
jgi:hypothetical protein